MRISFFCLVAVVFVQAAASMAGQLKKSETVPLYEVVVRHFLAVRTVPSTADVWVTVDGAPAPKALVERFRGERPTVRPNPCDGSISPDYVCTIQNASTTSEGADVMVWGYPDHTIRLYRLEKKEGKWVLLSDEHVTAD